MPNGSIISIHVHNDGYYSHHAPLLLNHYNSAPKIMKLMKLGDLSSLDSTLDLCFAYGRDRGEQGTEAQTSHDEKHFEDLFEEYVYLFRRGKWVTKFNPSHPWVDLDVAEVTERLST
jgi:hypothetical protein